MLLYIVRHGDPIYQPDSLTPLGERQAEAIQAAVDAQIALNNAMKNRNVRIYNAKTGQWEWVANPNDVANAKKARDDALADVAPENMDTYYDLLAKAILAAYNPALSDSGLREVGAGTSKQLIGTIHNGDNYNMGQITLSELEAKTTTLYDLAQAARSLILEH